MRIGYTEADEAFRQEVRAFLKDKLPADLARRTELGYHPRKDDLKLWNRILFEKGWIAPHWPVAHGGTGWTPTQKHIFALEMAMANAPAPSVFGLLLVGPVIYTFGSAEQKARFLPRILSGDEFWAQGYSEPGSGSDLASLKTRAVREGDHYVVNGHKIWTTEAHYADWLFCLVRTRAEGKIQEGISFLLIDMKSPGISVRPIVTIDEGHSVNEVFLDDVRVPVGNLVGEENKGWTYAKFLLTNERTGSAAVPRSRRDLVKLKEIAAREEADGRPLLEDPGFRERIARVEIELESLEYSVLRVLDEESRGRDPGPVASILKVRGSEIRQQIAALWTEALGTRAFAFHPDPEAGSSANLPAVGPAWAPGLIQDHLFRRATTIYGGTNEVQRNIIAKAALGL